MNPNYSSINITAQLKDSNSLLNFWRKMIQLRKQHGEVFVYGSLHIHDLDNENSFTFEKRAVDGSGRVALVVLSFSNTKQTWTRPKNMEDKTLELLTANVSVKLEERLGPWEARVYLVN